ncbi:MAG: hypothetical protein DRP01_02185, partial [Archaeoglobales archaeon]
MSITLRGEHFKRDFDYMVYEDGDYFKVLNGDSLAIDYKDKDASTAVAKAISFLTPDRTRKEIVKLKGNFVLTAPIELDSYMILDLRGAKLLLADGVNDSIIKADSKSHFEIIGGLLDGNRDNQTAGEGIDVINCRDFLVKDVFIENSRGHGVLVRDGSERGTVDSCTAINTSGAGFCLSSLNGEVRHVVVSNSKARANNYNGIFLYFGTRQCSVIGCSVREVTFGWGIEFENVLYCQAIGNNIRDCLGIGMKITGSSGIENAFIGNSIYNVGKHGIVVNGNYNVVMGNVVERASNEEDGRYDGIGLAADDGGGGVGSGSVNHNIIKENIIIAPTFYNGLRHGIREYGGDHNIIAYNTIIPNEIRHEIIMWVGSNTRVGRNIGFVTENSGEATISAGSTYVDVPHGLDVTPDPNKIRIVPKDDLGGRSYWISDVDASKFRINIG